MRTKFRGILTLLLALVVQMTFAQEKTVSGTVTESSGQPLPGASVVVRGTTKGTQTDFDGKYSIKANVGDVLVFSYVGMETTTQTVGASNTIDVNLKEGLQLEEVIVTAQGIKREKRELGYSVSSVSKEQLENKAESDLGRVLSGKASGVNITSTSGLSGTGTNIIIRGYTTISGSNQPLFVVDGVPFDGGTNSQTSFADGNTESSRFLDLDPNNIENIEVLKGLNATVLYGEQGKNGVILITTKNASSGNVAKKLEVSISQSYFVSEAVLPDYTKEFGGGFHQDFGFFFSNWGPRFSDPIPASNPLFIRRDANGTNIVVHPFSRLGDLALRNAFPEVRDSEYEYKFYNSVKNFFRTGSVQTTSMNLRGGSENANFNMNYSYLEDEGFTPGNKITRNNFGVGGSAKLSNKITASGTLNFAITDFNSPPLAASLGSGTVGDGSSIFGDVMYTPTSVDLMGMPFQTPDGRSIYYRSGNDIQNPLWTVNNSKNTQNTTRVFGTANLTYAFTDWLNLTYRMGLDTYSEFNTSGQNKGGVDSNPGGFYRTISAFSTIWDHTVLLSGEKNLTKDINIKGILGGTTRRNLYRQDGVESLNQIAFGTLEHFNFVDHSTVNSFSNGNIGFQSEVNTVGVYGDFTVGYKDWVYLNASGRNEWTSTLERENFSIFYKGASLSFIPTTAFPSISTKNGLNYLKIRVGYGESAGFPDAFSTRNTLGLNARAFDNSGTIIPTNSVSNRLGNPNLTPETIEEIEVGFDTKFLNNRVGLNVSYFNKTTNDLITDRDLDPATGFTVTQINAGELEVEGLEIDWDITPILTENFKWKLYGNFYADESTVNKLPEGVDQIGIAGFIGTAANYAIEGQPFGVIKGPGILRDANGNKVVDGFGNYIATNDDVIIGDPNADWTASFGTSFDYKGFNFTTNWQYRHGGDIWSQSIGATIGRGTVNVPFNREATFILPGVKQDGTPNDIQITAANAGFDNFGFAGARGEPLIFDGSTIRLQEVSLGYTVPAKFLEKTPFGSLSFTASGFNLWYDAVNTPSAVKFDPNTLSTGVGNGQGLDFISGPSSRRYGFSLKASF
ncbi:MAG: SusC/RagA family TonB-linked outer membrane protein [Flavobacteriaceae bacterium]|nr:SusC/RagA family TonB-linked outer membrane protein [Flavobacteriaceae bacterium]